ncbi:MAG: SMC family ATPase, partial [archaeon]
MKINRLFLRNIRSYTEQEIHFPNGSILLSGNIGCGKSTVLLAMDFALFGLQRGNLTGAALLRNGADKGEVELDFEIDDQKITIRRSLKRSKEGVGQEAGSITINGEYQDGTAIELKQKVLELLNYPKDLLTKNKSLIFRYTVYTPQEEMKQILLGDKNDRLETLRKVFGIDKYKRVKENTKIILSKVREKKREYTGYTSDLNEKNLMLIQKLDEVRLIETKVKELEPLVENQVKNVEEKKNQIKDSEEKIKHLTELKKEFELGEVNRTHKLNDVEKTIKDIEKLNLEIEELQKESLEGNPETIKDLIQEKNIKLLELENKIKQYSNLMQDIKTKKQVSDEVKLKIQELSSCPMCHQEVS